MQKEMMTDSLINFMSTDIQHLFLQKLSENFEH